MIKKIKLLKGKKGTAEQWLEIISYIILISVVMVLIFALVNMLINTGVNVQNIQPEVAFYRIMYSPNSITYTDNITGELYTGIIDLDRFDNEILDKSISYSYEKQISARLDLYTVIGSRFKIKKTAYLNQVWYERLEPLASAGIIGLGSAKKFVKIIPVTYEEEGDFYPGLLRAVFVLPN